MTVMGKRHPTLWGKPPLTLQRRLLRGVGRNIRGLRDDGGRRDHVPVEAAALRDDVDMLG